MAQSHGQEEWCAASLAIETVQQQLSRCLFYVSKLSNHPLFSILTTSSLLILLYLPRPLIPLLLSPVPISSLLLLLLLRSGSKPDNHLHQPIQDHHKSEPESKTGTEHVPALQDHFFFHSGPLEVIYEEHEGEHDGDSPTSNEIGCLGFGYFGLCFTDSDLDSDSDSDSDSGGNDPANLRFRWRVEEEEEEEEEMIEIALEEENLIEIDISGYQR